MKRRCSSIEAPESPESARKVVIASTPGWLIASPSSGVPVDGRTAAARRQIELARTRFGES